jgi:CII-binding regulator of phage lambda lysogenization HflD
MAILDTFYLLFKSDTSELKKGADEAFSIIRNIRSTLLSVVPAGLAAFSIKGALDFGTELAKTSRILGVNVEDLNAWRNTVELAGGDANQFESTISSLANRFNTSSQTILRLLPRYADALSKLSPARAQQIGKNLFGLDEGTILLLQHSRREVEDMVRTQKSLGVITQQNAQQFLIYQQATKKLDIEFRGLFLTLAKDALPYFIKFFDVLSDGVHFLREHKDFVVGLGIAITALGIRFAIATLPITLMSALLVGLILLFSLVYDDVQAFLNGQKSILGYITNHYPRATAVIKEFISTLKELKGLLTGDTDILDTVNDRISRFADHLQSLNPFKLDFFGTGGTVSTPPSSSFLQSHSLSNNNNSKKVEINQVTINTQATNAPGIASDLLNALNSSYAQVSNYHADGVTA